MALTPGKSGFRSAKEMVIGLDQDLAANGQVQVLSHEEAHALGIDYERFGRPRAEAIVECAAFVVCARIGLDVSASAVPYVASWAKEEAAVIQRDSKGSTGLLGRSSTVPGWRTWRHESRRCP